MHTLVCLGTIEERIDAMIAEKRTLAEMAVGSDEGWLAGSVHIGPVSIGGARPEAVR